MTHPAYSQTALTAMTVTQLKTIANQLGAIPDGDKRVKQTWVSAILDHQIEFSPEVVAEVMERSKEAELLINLPITDDVANDAEMGLPSSEGLTEPDVMDGSMNYPSSKKVGASIVLIALSAILSAIFLAPIGLGIIVYRAIRLFLVGHLPPRSGNPRQTAIDYFPFPA